MNGPMRDGPPMRISNNVEVHFGWSSGEETEANSIIFPLVHELIRSQTMGLLKVLDCGCGNGSLLRTLVGKGHQLIGIDASADGIEIARSSIPAARFESCSLYDSDLSVMIGDDFDVVVSLEVIEHLYWPSRFLESAFKIMKPGGLLILSTPYHGYLKNLAISLLNRWDRHFTVDWEGGHIKFFSKRTLGEMAMRSGFSELSFQGVGRVPFLWKSMVLTARK